MKQTILYLTLILVICKPAFGQEGQQDLSKLFDPKKGPITTAPGTESNKLFSVKKPILSKNILAGIKIHFDSDSDVVQATSHAILRELGKMLAETYSNTTIVIHGHADSSGDIERNFELGFMRAAAVKKFLVDVCNVPSNRIKLSSLGETWPIMSNDTEEGRSLNRRVEFENLVSEKSVYAGHDLSSIKSLKEDVSLSQSLKTHGYVDSW